MKTINELCDLVRQTAVRIEHGLLVNFGSYKFQIKKYAFSPGMRSGLKNGLATLFFNLFALFAFFRG